MHLTLSTQKPIQFTPKTWALMPKNAHSPTIHHAHISSPQLSLSQNPMTMHSKNILLHPNRSFQKTYEKPPTAAALSPFLPKCHDWQPEKTFTSIKTRPPGHQRPHTTCLAASQRYGCLNLPRNPKLSPERPRRMRKLTEFWKPSGSRVRVGGIRCGEMWRSPSGAWGFQWSPSWQWLWTAVTGLRYPSGSF